MKPIVVLLLILAALGALFFGLFTMGKTTPTPTDNGPEVARVETPQVQPVAPVERTMEANDRSAGVEEKTEASRVVSDPTAYVYSNELRVQVLTPEGKPLRDVEVTLTTISSNDLFFADDSRAPFQVGPQRTDKDGRTSFVGVQPRRKYTLVAVHPEYARAEQDTVPVDQDGVIDEPPIVMRAGAKLQGYVKDEQGNVVPAATLVLEGMLYQASQFAAPDRMEVQSNADGFYVFNNVARGGRTLTVSAAGYGRKVIHGIAFEKDEPQNVDVLLRAAQMLCGRVIGPSNTPLVGARVIAIGINNTMQTARDEVLSNERGEFCFESLAPGEYNLVANLRGYRFTAKNRVPTNTSDTVLEGMREASLCGQVVDASTGMPVTDFMAQVRHYSDPNTPTYPGTVKQSFKVTDGQFCLEGVQQGEYVVEAWANGYAPTRSSNFVVTQGKDVKGISIRLSRGGSISGRVVDPDGRGIAKARLMTRPNDWADDAFFATIEDMLPSHVTQVEVRAGSDGSFTLPNLSPDTYQVIVEAIGYTRTSKLNIVVQDGMEQRIGDIVLPRGGSVTGMVLDGSGKGVPGAIVTLAPADAQALPGQYSAKTAADGRYTLRSIPAGRFYVRANRSNSADANPLEELQVARDSERQIVVAEGQETRMDLTIQQ